jgi:hypothetical protein
MPRALRTQEGGLTGLGKAVLATVASTLIVGILYGAVGLVMDMRSIKEQQLFYHGPWPPVHGAPQ